MTPRVKLIKQKNEKKKFFFKKLQNTFEQMKYKFQIEIDLTPRLYNSFIKWLEIHSLKYFILWQEDARTEDAHQDAKTKTDV